MADAEAEVALAAIEDGDGVEGVQLYVCGQDGELELLALEGTAGGRRWHLKARAADLVTAQFALMFTEDLPGSLEEINGVLCEGGILVGTVWEDFFLLPLIRDTMTAVLGSAPPPPPINPLSLKDVDLVDGALADAGFTTFGRHNETAQIDINLGPYKSDDTIKCTLIPVTPSLAELQEKGEHGDDVFVFWPAPHASRQAGSPCDWTTCPKVAEWHSRVTIFSTETTRHVHGSPLAACPQ